jgi:TP901 family phage tail tape measure protein
VADNSKVLVRLQLLGGSLFSREAKASGRALEGIGRGGRAAGTGLQRTSSSGSQASSALGRVQAATRRTAGEMTKLRSSAERALSPVKRIMQGGAAAAGLGFGAAIKDSANFEQSMANVQSRLVGEKGLEGSMGRLSRLALQLGAKTQFSAGQAADAMGALAAQGFNANQIMRVLPGTLSLAAASGTDLASAATIQTETLHGFGLQAGKAGVVADVLAQIANRSAADIDDMQESLKYIAPVAKASGQSLQDMGAAIGLMANVGIKGSQAGTTLRTAMVRLSNPTDKARSALATLHLKAGDLAGKKGLLSLPNIMAKLSKGAQGVSKNQRNAAIATIFGREALSGMVALVEKGPAKLKRLGDALRNSSGAAKRAATIQRKTVKGAFDNLTGSVETAAITLTKKYMPAIRDALNAGAGGVNQFTAGLTTGRAEPRRRVIRGPGGRVERVETTQASGAQRAGAGVRGVISAVAAGARSLAAQAVPAVRDVVKQVLDALKPAMPFVRNVLLPLLEGIGKGVLGSVVGAFKVAVPIIKIVATVLGFVGRAARPLRPIIQGIGTVIGFLMGGPILKALGTLPKVGIVFRLMAVPLRLVGGVGKIRGLITGIVGRLRAAPRAMVNAAGRIGKAIVDGIVNVIKRAPAAIAGALAWVVDNLPVPGFVKGKVKDVLGVHAAGGVVRAPLQVLGERGPELAALPRGSRVFTASQTREMLAPRRGAMPMAAPAFPHIYIRFQPTLDSRVVHDSVHKVERAKVEAT